MSAPPRRLALSAQHLPLIPSISIRTGTPACP